MSDTHIQDSGPERATVADYTAIVSSLREFSGASATCATCITRCSSASWGRPRLC
jgi:hypothetical protein